MFARIVKIILLVVVGVSCYAQPYASRLGGFQVLQKRGCAPFTINIQLLTGVCPCDFAYGDGVNDNTKVHTYSQPGTYTVKALFTNETFPCDADPTKLECNSDDIIITVTPNVQPAFEISSCTNARVSIKVTDTQYNQYLVDFNNDNTIDNTIASGQAATYNYGVASAQTIKVKGQDFNGAANCINNSKNFNALATLPTPTINTLTVVDAASIKLDYTPNTNIQYRAQVSANSPSSFQQFQTFNSASSAQQTLTLNALTTDDKYYCFHVNAYDPCNNTSVLSNTICSTNFDLNIVSDVNKLSWATSNTGVTDFTIKRNQANYPPNVTGFSFDDVSITCNTDYTYSLVTNYADGTTSISLEKSGRSFTSKIPSAIKNTSAVVSDNAVDLIWIQDPTYTAQSYNINRSVSSGAFSFLANTTTTTYSDATYSPEGNYCYMINYTDICANQSPDGSTVCPIQLTGTLGSNNEVHLSWSSYLGWKTGVQLYHIDKYDNQGVLLQTFDKSGTTLTLNDNAKDPDNQTVEYVVRAEPKDGTLIESVSNRFKITRQAKLIFPTAFTPNTDNLNERFTVKGQYVENMTLQIFDRWGTLLFTTTTNEPWNGTYNGQTMPESTYIWKALVTDKAGNTFSKVGSVALLRPAK